ncbi:hypothetical protein DJ88_2257 [Bacillus paralicheniformis]|nr:hypothetical protein DJ88_2257 [Bacillus paralicheniformis]
MSIRTQLSEKAEVPVSLAPVHLERVLLCLLS